ncbi:MAG: hypothetical protein R2867_37695 [Caldilineaceae bacterium]
MGFAALAAATGLASHSARLYAAVMANEGDYAVTCWPPDKLECEYYIGQVRAKLSNAAFVAAQEEGRALSMEQLAAYALHLPLSDNDASTGRLGTAANYDCGASTK